MSIEVKATKAGSTGSGIRAGRGVVAIVGRPNVGKSTLFNRLTEARNAIVKEIPGVTRDRIYGISEWNGVEFNVIDTGGYVKGSEDTFESEIRKQVEIAIQEADVILFVVDNQVGVSGYDDGVAELLRKAGKPVFVVANKVDATGQQYASADFYGFGLGEVFPVSAINGSGSGELLDELVKHLPKPVEIPEEEIPRIAIIGRPNVGKSSLLNAFMGEERHIVTPISGTTRDSVDTRFKAFGFDMVLVDTAGIRKKNKVYEDVEFYSVIRSVRSIESCDVCLVLIDATEGLNKQDLNIFYMAHRNHKGVVVLVNKWDLIEKDTNLARDMEKDLKEKLAPFNDVPILFTSAEEKVRIHKALETAMQVYENRIQRISTSQLNDFLQEVMEKTPPPSVKGKYIKIKFVTQLPTHAPAFAFFCNLPQYVKDPYKRFLENQIRKRWNFTGVPIRIYFRKK